MFTINSPHRNFIQFYPFLVRCLKDASWEVTTDEILLVVIVLNETESSVLNKLSSDRHTGQSQPSQISHCSSTLNCDFSHRFQPTPFKLVLTQSSLCALSKELSPSGHKNQKQRCGIKMWGWPKFLKIGP